MASNVMVQLLPNGGAGKGISLAERGGAGREGFVRILAVGVIEVGGEFSCDGETVGLMSAIAIRFS